MRRAERQPSQRDHVERQPASDDAWIAEAIGRGEHREALAALARVHGAALGRLCISMLGNAAEAEELAQEILLAAHAAMPSFEGRSSVRRWLYTIAQRSCAHARRRRARRRRLDVLAAVDSEARACPPVEPDAELESARWASRLRRALEQLSDGQQDVLLLRYVVGLSYGEIGEVCQLREDAARQRAAAGLKALRRELTASGPTLARVLPLVASTQEQMP